MTDPRESRPVRRRIDPWTGKEYPPSKIDGVLAILGMVLVAGVIVAVIIASGIIWFGVALFVLLPIAVFTRGRYPRR